MFHRHPRLPEVLNTVTAENEKFVIEDPEEQLEEVMKRVKALNEKVGSKLYDRQLQ